MTLVSREERQNKQASFQVFARVDGRTLVLQVWEGMLVSELRAEIARRLHASHGQCYVTWGGKLLSLSSSVEAAGAVKGSCVELHARGCGGSVPGEWFCNHCNRGGCWPERQRCFRCGMARGDGSPGKGGKAKGNGRAPQRETSYPGRGWQSKVPKPAGEGTMPVHVPLEVVTQLLDVLQGLGVSQHVPRKIRSKASQASQNARVVPGRARRHAELEEKWFKAASHLEVLREQMTRKEHEYLAGVEKFEPHGKQVRSLEEEGENSFALASSLGALLQWCVRR